MIQKMMFGINKDFIFWMLDKGYWILDAQTDWKADELIRFCISVLSFQSSRIAHRLQTGASGGLGGVISMSQLGIPNSSFYLS